MIKYIPTIVAIVIIQSCISKNSTQKIEFDISNYKQVFRDNSNQFNHIGNLIDSTTKQIMSKKELQVFFQTSFSKLTIQDLSGKTIYGKAEIDSLDGLYFFRVQFDDNTVSHCASFSYCYSTNINSFISKGQSSKRNIRYEVLSQDWLLEVDNSSPCID